MFITNYLFLLSFCKVITFLKIRSMKVKVNDFIRRQTKLSGKTYSEELSFEFFLQNMHKKKIT